MDGLTCDTKSPRCDSAYVTRVIFNVLKNELANLFAFFMCLVH
jgi:hypothetical protein